MVKKAYTPSENIRQATMEKLKERGVEIADIAQIVYDLQTPYQPQLTMEDCIESVHAVLKKREIQHALLVGIQLDILAEQNKLFEPLQSLIASDEGLFGIDETIALSGAFTYGSIAATTFGYLDKAKKGIIAKLDTKAGNDKVHTFLDDLVGMIAACAAARVAHVGRDKQERSENIID